MIQAWVNDPGCLPWYEAPWLFYPVCGVGVIQAQVNNPGNLPGYETPVLLDLGHGGGLFLPGITA